MSRPLKINATLGFYFAIVIFNHSPLGYITMNEQGFIQDANITLEKMLGLGRSEMLNKPYFSPFNSL